MHSNVELVEHTIHESELLDTRRSLLGSRHIGCTRGEDWSVIQMSVPLMSVPLFGTGIHILTLHFHTTATPLRLHSLLKDTNLRLSLMTSNSNNSTADSPCCSSTGGTDSRNHTTNATNNTNMNLNSNDETNHLQPTVQQSNTPLSPSTSSVCALTTPYDSRLISGYPRLGGFYGSSYSEQNSFYTSGTNPFYSSFVSYPRLGGFYGSSYSEQNSFYTSGTNPFYSSFGNPYDLKDQNGNGWGALPQTTCYPYEPTIYSPYGERYNAMDSATRRKNATRETTNTLKAWLYEHRKNPYPTKGEKIMLAIITKMTLTQVSTWFANARRRLKKENKMTWEPRNKSTDGHDSDDKDSIL
ncbi:unnamed protein product [Oppiella nova]|uniref:Homeobox domain-containing protein n=1 Tax=Oppiella nova TaxID=334625 RepID=A0A7R9LNR8_9ACAR|nr:unnamed protein product [Oppiella nova]CAG2165465.1 unnamed protein product [Oppiella nova]